MKTWLHFIGQQYYKNPKAFQGEAREYGITRRVARNLLKNMNFGDRVLLAMNDQKSSVIFGQFIIHTLSGMSHEEGQLLRDKVEVTFLNDGGRTVRRGCGSYIEGPTMVLAVPISIPEILAIIEPATVKGKLMVGGDFDDRAREPIRLRSVRCSQGFREFDYQRFLHDTSAGNDKVKGFYYTNEETPLDTNIIHLDQYLVQQVNNYGKK